MITAVLLDLDNTLFNFDKAEAIALKRMLEHFGIEASDEVAGIYHGINDKYWKMLEKGKVTRGELRVKRFDELFEQLGIGLLGCEATPIYEGFLGSGHYYMEHAEE